MGGGYIKPLRLHLIGPKRAKQMAFQPGGTMAGVEAADWGWANYAVSSERLLEDVADLGGRIKRTGSETFRVKKCGSNRLCKLRGFRAQSMLGAELDSSLHFTDESAAIWTSVRDNGLKRTASELRAEPDRVLP